MKIIKGIYQLEKKIGVGGMGDIYRAIDTRTGEMVAVKHLRPEVVAFSPEMLDRFITESELLRELSHPNIVPLLDVVSEGDNHYFVMDYIEGGDLKDRLAKSPGGLPINETLSIALELADALTRAHHLDVIHRDIKPANVLMAADGTPRLTDFGIAHSTEGIAHTAHGEILGTYAYLSPEACMGDPVDSRVDIWAFGVLLYELLTGRRPFIEDAPPALMMAIVGQPFSDAQEIRPEISDDLNALLYRMLAKNKAERIPLMRLVGAEIEALLKGIDIGTDILSVSPMANPIINTISVFRPPTPAIDAARHNLPSDTTDFVGREGELSRIGNLLADPAIRLITLLAPGGMGKTRLSIEVGRQQLGHYSSGVFLVPLAPLIDPMNIPSAIAEAAGYPFQTEGSPREQIISFLVNKQMLLIFDNFEHLIEGCNIVADILNTAPNITILVTSRVRLNLIGESVFTLGGMDYPDWESPEDALNYSAVQLFMQSAKRSRVDFKLSADDLPPLAQICRLVGGVPLGLVLAAGWVDTLPLDEIASEITESIDFLESELSDMPERQRSIRAAFEYSWRLLGEEERSAFSRLAIFRGGCSHRAAKQVTGAGLRKLTGLANKSLLRRDPESGRFTVHELLRQIAEEYLDESGEKESIRAAHADYYLKALASKEADLKGGDQIAALNDIEVDFENLRAAWLHAIESDQHSLLSEALAPLWLYCRMRNRYADGEELLGAARDTLSQQASDEAANLWGRALTRAELFAPVGRQLSNYTEDFQKALEAARTVGDREAESFALYALGWVERAAHNFAECIALMEESRDICEEIGDSYLRALTLNRVSFPYLYLGDVAQAEATIRQAVDLQRENGDLVGLGLSLNNLGAFHDGQGDADQAIKHYDEGLAIAQKTGDKATEVLLIRNEAEHFLNRNDLDMAKILTERALAIAEEINNASSIATSITMLFEIGLAQEEYEEVEELAKKVSITGGANIEDIGHSLRALVTAAVGQDDYDRAKKRLIEWLPPAMHYAQGRAGCLRAQALFFAHDGELERAAELTELANVTYGVYRKYEQVFPLFKRLYEQMKSGLGEEDFLAARERGAGLDLDETFNEVFEQYLE